MVARGWWSLTYFLKEKAEEFINKKTKVYYLLPESDMSYSTQVLRSKLFNEPVEEEEPFTIKPNQILIGFRSPQYSLNNPVVIDVGAYIKLGGKVERQSKVFAILGRKGSGKSVDMGILIDAYHYAFHLPILIIDPYGEFHTHVHPFAYTKPPQYQAFITEFLSQFGLKPKGLKLKVIAPEILRNEQDTNIDRYFSISYYDIRQIMKYSKMDAISALINLLGLADNDANTDLLLSVINDKIYTWSDLMKAMSKAKESNVKTIFYRIKARLRAGIITDDESKGLNILKELAENEAVVVRGKLRNVEDDDYITQIYNAYIQILITTAVLDIKTYIETQGKAETYLKNDQGMLIAIDEIDSLAPATGKASIRDTITQLATKYRKSMVNLVFATQSAKKVDSTLLEQVDYLIVSTIDDTNANALTSLNISDEWLLVLRQLKQGVITNIQTKVSQKALINPKTADPASKVIIYYPICPLSQFFEAG